jgi:hypothetical protein
LIIQALSLHNQPGSALFFASLLLMF